MTALEGVRVIEAGLLVQGPQAAATLGLLGAEMIKVELPVIGDQSRWLPAGVGDTRSAYFTACNRGKRSVTLDLRKERGRDAFLRLVETADVLITNFQPGTMEGWGLGFDVLAARNPRLVYAAGSAFGSLGPDAERAGADLSAQASGGLIAGTGVDGGDPTPVAATIADHISGQNLVAGILAALVARGRTGRGQKIDVSLLGSQIWAQASEYTAYLLTGSLPGRANFGNPMIGVIYGIFPTADGWLALVGVGPQHRGVLYDLLGRPELATDDRFSSLMLSEAQKAELFPLLGEAFKARPTAEWCELLAPTPIRYAPVRTYAEVVDDPQVWANGYFHKIEVDGDEATVVGSPIAMSDSPVHVGGAVPTLGQHTDEVLLELGFSADDVAALRAAGGC